MHHLIFEGAELSGKSWIMSQIHDTLEPKYNQSGFILDGCHWFNCDVGVFGTENANAVINDYTQIFSTLQKQNIIIEKFHLSDLVYQHIFKNKVVNYSEVEQKLFELNFKIILIIIPEDIDIIKNRLADRLRLYPHYARIQQTPEWYLNQQNLYLANIKKSKLPYLIVPTDKLPDERPIKKILDWINE